MSFKYQGNDITTLFIVNKDDNTPDTKFFINGQDISGLFQKYINGDKQPDIGYSNGITNLSSYFQKIGVPLNQPVFKKESGTQEEINNRFINVTINTINYKYLVISNNINSGLLGINDGNFIVYTNGRKIYIYVIGCGGGGASGSASYGLTGEGAYGGKYKIVVKTTDFKIIVNNMGAKGLGGIPGQQSQLGSNGTNTLIFVFPLPDEGYEIYNAAGGTGGKLSTNPVDNTNSGTKLARLDYGVCGTGGNNEYTDSVNGSGPYSMEINGNDAIYYGGGGGGTGVYGPRGGNGYDGAVIIYYAE